MHRSMHWKEWRGGGSEKGDCKVSHDLNVRVTKSGISINPTYMTS